MSSLSRQQLVHFLRQVDITEKRVLDCGCGAPKHYALNWVRGEPSLYHTLDVNAEFEPDFAIDLNLYTGEAMGCHYDTVFLLETAEHLWNPLQAVENIHHWLKPGGEFYWSVPFINPIHDVVDYLRFTAEWWEKAAEVVGFEVDYIKPRVASDGWRLLREFYHVEGLRMSKIRLQAGDGAKIGDIGYFGRFVKP